MHNLNCGHHAAKNFQKPSPRTGSKVPKEPPSKEKGHVNSTMFNILPRRLVRVIDATPHQVQSNVHDQSKAPIMVLSAHYLQGRHQKGISLSFVLHVNNEHTCSLFFLLYSLEVIWEMVLVGFLSKENEYVGGTGVGHAV